MQVADTATALNKDQARLKELTGGGGLKKLLGLCVGAFGDISTDLHRLVEGQESAAFHGPQIRGRGR